MLDSQMKLVGQHKRMILVSTRPNQVIKLDSDEPQIWFKTRNHLQVQKLVDVVHTPKKTARDAQVDHINQGTEERHGRRPSCSTALNLMETAFRTPRELP